jgi:hypothetical protein
MAASAQGIRAGRAYVELFADDSKLMRALKLAETKLKAFGDAVTAMGRKMLAAGTAIVAPLLAAPPLPPHPHKLRNVHIAPVQQLGYAGRVADVGEEQLTHPLTHKAHF